MNVMTLLLQVVPPVFFLSLCTMIIKLSAGLARLKISWAHSLLFSLLVCMVGIGARVASFATGILLPVPLELVSGFSINVILGGWFFRVRARSVDGQPAGMRGGMKIAAIPLVLLGMLVAVLIAVLPYAAKLGP